jgi:hypothetical protein
MVVILDKANQIYGEINKLETTEIEELKFYDYDEVQTFVSFGFLLLAEIGLRNNEFYLKVKSVEALSDFHLAQLLINFNGSLKKMRLKE